MKKQVSNIVNRVLSESFSNRTKKRRIFEDKEMCSECGGGMYEGECMECGYMKESVHESKKLSKGQKYIAKQANPKDKIDANDFKKLRAKKTETKEGKKFPDLSGDGKITRKDVLLGRGVKLNGKKKETKENEECYECGGMYELYLDESTGEKFLFTEKDILNIIESIVLEEKKKKSSKNDTKSAQSQSKSENEKNIKNTNKKFQDHLKDGSKGKYETNPKHFPKGNGELAKMEKMAYVPSSAAKEYVKNFTGAGLEMLEWDELHPDEKRLEKYIVGSSETGNNPDWANAVETDVNKERNELRKNNLLSKVKRNAYQKDDQPIKFDRTGSAEGDSVENLIKKYSSKKLKENIAENEKVILEMQEIKKLMRYNTKTQ